MTKTKTTTTTVDDQVMGLIAEVTKQKKSIANSERSDFKTNRMFSWVEGSSDVKNLAVESDIRTLISMAAFLIEKESAYQNAISILELNLDEVPKFKWNDCSTADWISDIKARIDKLQVKAKKAKLEILEARLGKLISPEMQREMELKAIQAELEN